MWNHETVGKWEKWPQITHSQRCPKFWFSSGPQVFIWYLWKRSPGTSFFPFTTNELAAFWSQFEPSTSYWIPYASVYLRVSQMTIFTSLLHHHIPFLCGHSPCKHVVLSLIKKKKKNSLDLQLPPVPQFSTFLYGKTCKMNGLYLLSLIQSLFGITVRLFITHHCTKIDLIHLNMAKFNGQFSLPILQD